MRHVSQALVRAENGHHADADGQFQVQVQGSPAGAVVSSPQQGEHQQVQSTPVRIQRPMRRRREPAELHPENEPQLELYVCGGHQTKGNSHHLLLMLTIMNRLVPPLC